MPTLRERYDAYKASQQQGPAHEESPFRNLSFAAPPNPALSTRTDAPVMTERGSTEMTLRERYLVAKKYGLLRGQQGSAPSPAGQTPPVVPVGDRLAEPPIPKDVLYQTRQKTFGFENRDIFPVTPVVSPQEKFERIASGLYSGITTGGLVGRPEFEGKPGYEAGELVGLLAPTGATNKVLGWGFGKIAANPTVQKVAKETASWVNRKIIPEALKQVKNRVKTSAGKAVLTMILKADDLAARFSGTAKEGLRQKGLDRLSKEEGIALSDAIETGKAKEYTHIIHNLYKLARSAGLPIGHVENYFPRYFKRDIQEALFTDLRLLRTRFGENFNGSDQAIIKAIEKASQTTQKAVSDMVKGGMRLDDALRLLDRQHQSQLFMKAGFEHERVLELPGWMYERDARVVLPHYIDQLTKRVAESRIMGSTLGKVDDALAKIGATDIEERGLVERLVKSWTGKLEFEEGWTGWKRALVNKYTNFQFGTKIGMGTATIPNVTQSFISSIPKNGGYAFVRGGMNLIEKAERSQIRKSGALPRDLLHSVLGDTPDATWRGFADLMGEASGFSGINRANQYLAASSIKQAVLDWQRKAIAGGSDMKGAIEQIKKLGYRWGKKKDFWKAPIPDHKMKEIMYRFAVDSQLQRNILNDPMMFNNPKFRALFLFKRFGYRQFAFIKDMLKQELSEGNAKPLLRLAAGGYAGGEFVIWAKNSLKEGISGRPYFRKEDHLTMHRFLNNVAAVGSFGVMSDLFDVEDMTGLVHNLEFMGGPVAYSDANQLFTAATRVAATWDQYKDFATGEELQKIVWERNKHLIPSFFGSIPRAAGQRLKTERTQNTDRTKARSKMAKEIRTLERNGETEEATRLINLWNERHPTFPITGVQVGGGAITEEVRRNRKAIEEVLED